MLRLWPETIYAGLFHGHCWLKVGGTEFAYSVPLTAPRDSRDLLRAIEAMLDERGATLRKGSRLVITVSDSTAAFTTLPWQDALTGQDELNSYAKACFEKLGTSLGDGWVMRTEFRQHGAHGIAYALPRDWLVELIELTEKRGLRLKSVMPVSAAAYCAQRTRQRVGRTVLLLREESRTSAMVYDKAALLGCDVEPVTTSPQESGVRLLRRISATYDNITDIADWSPSPNETKSSPAIALCFPDVKSRRLQHSVWS